MLLNKNKSLIDNPNFTEFQKEVIRTICEVQKESLIKLYGEGVEEWEEFKELYNIIELNREEVIDNLSDNFYKFTEVSEDPDKLFCLDPMYLSIFAHILFHTDDQWRKQNEDETKELWRKLFIVQDFGKEIKPIMN